MYDVLPMQFEAHFVLFRIRVERNLSVNKVLLVGVVHLRQDKLSTFLVDADLCLNHSVIDEADESSNALVVHACKA